MLGKRIISLIIIIPLMLSFACSKDFEIISKTYSTWTGGVEGVRGKKYRIQLSMKPGKKNTVQFLKLTVGDTHVPLQQEQNGGDLLLNAVYTEPRPERTVPLHPNTASSAINKTVETVLWYKVLKSGKLKSIKLENWTLQQREPNEALIQ